MGSYVESNLIKDEQVQYEGKISIWSLLPKILLGSLLLLFYGVGLIFWASAAITYFNVSSG